MKTKPEEGGTEKNDPAAYGRRRAAMWIAIGVALFVNGILLPLLLLKK